jgi:hypothetical protein
MSERKLNTEVCETSWITLSDIPYEFKIKSETINIIKTNGEIWKENGGGIERTAQEAANEKGKRTQQIEWDVIEVHASPLIQLPDEYEFMEPPTWGWLEECNHEWEQASGWFAGPITWECKHCGEVKKKMIQTLLLSLLLAALGLVLIVIVWAAFNMDEDDKDFDNRFFFDENRKNKYKTLDELLKSKEYLYYNEEYDTLLVFNEYHGENTFYAGSDFEYIGEI